MRNTRPRRRTTVPRVDQLESRQLLSTTAMPVHGPVLAHPHHALRMHHSAVVERVHSGHHGGTDPVAASTVTGLHVVTSPTVANSVLSATAAIASNDIWAVGVAVTSTNSDATLAEHFQGTSWRVVPTPTLSKGASFTGVAAVASNDVWAVGAEVKGSSTFEPLIEHWDGTSWSIVSSPNLSMGGSLTAVTAVSSNNVWAVGLRDDFSGDLVEHWDGTSWSIVSSPAFTGANDILHGISADASNDVWAVGNSFVGAGPSILHFDGTNWSRVAAPRFHFSSLSAVTALSPTNVWAVGIGKGSNLCCSHALIEHWDGTSWSIVPSPNPNTRVSSILVGIAAISANDIWAVGSIGGFQSVTEHWDGTSWSIIASPNPGAGPDHLNGVTALGDGTVVAVGVTTNSSNISNGLILHN
jgi:hypothetical protein